MEGLYENNRRNPDSDFASSRQSAQDLRDALLEVVTAAAREDILIYKSIFFESGLPLTGRSSTDPHIRFLNTSFASGYGLQEIEKYLKRLLNGALSFKDKPLSKGSIKTLSYGIKSAVIDNLGMLYDHHDGCKRVVDNSFKPYNNLQIVPTLKEHLTFGHIHTLAHAAGLNSRPGLWVQFLLLSAQRISAACSIERRQLKFTANGVYIDRLRQKGGSLIRPVVPTSLIEQIFEHIPADKYLFETDNKKIYGRTAVANLLTRAAQKHLDPNMTLGPHALRHGFARHMRKTRPHLRDGIMLQGGWSNKRSYSTFDTTYGVEPLTERDLPSFENPDPMEFEHENA